MHVDSPSTIRPFVVDLQTDHETQFQRGTLTLTASQLRFDPESGSAVGTDVTPQEVDLLTLRDVTWTEDAATARLQLGDATWEITGPDAHDVFHRLRTLWKARTAGPGRGTATFSLDAAPPTAGRFILEGSRLRFRANGTQIDLLDVSWSSISDARLSGVQPHLTATIAGRSARIDGDVVPAIWEWLSRHSGPETQLADAPSPFGSNPCIANWKGLRMHGALGIQGELVVHSNHLQFIPDGLVERTLGLKPHVIPFEAIQRFAVRGWSNPRLEVFTEDQIEAFAIRSPEAVFQVLWLQLGLSLRRLPNPSGPWSPVLGEILGRWATEEHGPSFPVMETQLAVQLVGECEAELGALVQTAEEVQFLPARGPSGHNLAHVHAVPRILRNSGSAPPCADELVFSVAGQEYRYLPAGGATYVQRFWERCRAPSRILNVDGSSSRSLMRVLGPCRYRDLRGADGRKQSIVDLVSCGSTWTITLPPTDTPPSVGQTVSVDVGQPEGAYRFEALIIDHNRDSHELIIDRPSTVRVYNQRRSYRVAVDLTARVQLADSPGPPTHHGPQSEPEEPHSVSLRLVDLSLGGCAARGPDRLPQGASVALEVNLPEATPLRVRGRVLRAEVIEDSSLRRFGIQFEQVRRSEEARLQRHVLRAQRDERAGQVQSSDAAANLHSMGSQIR